MNLNENAFEEGVANIQRRKDRWGRSGQLSFAIAIISGLLGSVNFFSPAFMELFPWLKSDDNRLAVYIIVEYVVCLAGLVFFLLGMMEKGSGDYSDYVERLKKLLNDENLRADIDRELVKMAPMLQDMLKNISKNYPETGKKLLENNLSEKDSKLIIEFMRVYLKAHPKDARQFVNLLSAAQMPQDLIDRFIAEFVSDTISFRMAQDMSKGM
jgi:hypothetical protein